ncbi:GDSL-type esterase/lipase family protein [Methylomicrobium sp. Wu6]|uniref:GDSL-type esterase/lipase family protein n=1 Tax=Methylomicrobium sp. Wu6 TaxID=3107928 RepID=UPI002DD623DC|nr:GDSL-type esterase/lipase family protein [Methylomicrobium sp. Wu6]MEC4749103.1 GDSL-type esterase/lipase family protein [Methylomicrobium sp. Wu6]
MKIIPIALLLLLTACNKSSDTLSKLPSDAVILAFGDSLTYGTGASPQHDYPSILAKLTTLQVVNAGLPGEISGDGAKRLPALLDQHQPHLLILIHGGNDMLKRIPPEQTAGNLKQMITLAKNRQIGVVMLGVPKPAILWMSSADFYQATAEAMKVPIDVETLPEVLGDTSLKSDMIHPNDQGYERIATQIHGLLQKSGAL